MFFAPLADFFAGWEWAQCVSLNQAHHCLSISAHASWPGRNPLRIFCTKLLPLQTHNLLQVKLFPFDPRGHSSCKLSSELPPFHQEPEQGDRKMLIQEFLWRILSRIEIMEFNPLFLFITKIIRIFFAPLLYLKMNFYTSLGIHFGLITLHGDRYISCIPPVQTELPETCKKNWRIRLHITKSISRYCWECAGIFVRLGVWRLKICQVKLINHLLIAARSIMNHCWEKNRAHQREHQLGKTWGVFSMEKLTKHLKDKLYAELYAVYNLSKSTFSNASLRMLPVFQSQEVCNLCFPPDHQHWKQHTERK